MDGIILLTGNVKFSITIDPSVWIFDDRKISLDDAIQAEEEHGENLEQYAKRMSDVFTKELADGYLPPSEKQHANESKKEQLLKGNYAMPLAPFIENAEPEESASTLIVETEGGKCYELPLEKGKKALLRFSKDGKPLREDGPVHVYFGDSSNKEKPITHVKKFVIR